MLPQSIPFARIRSRRQSLSLETPIWGQKNVRRTTRAAATDTETQHFWDGTKTGELRLQRCNACGKVYFPPRPFCPACAARDVAVFAAIGKGRLYSYVIHHRPVPGFTPPYAIAVVELDEGPRMMTNIID